MVLSGAKGSTVSIVCSVACQSRFLEYVATFVGGSILFTQDSQPTKKSGKAWKNSLVYSGLGKIKESGKKMLTITEISRILIGPGEKMASLL